MRRLRAVLVGFATTAGQVGMAASEQVQLIVASLAERGRSHGIRHFELDAWRSGRLTQSGEAPASGLVAVTLNRTRHWLRTPGAIIAEAHGNGGGNNTKKSARRSVAPTRSGRRNQAGKSARPADPPRGGRSSGPGPGRVLLDVGPVERAGPGPGQCHRHDNVIAASRNVSSTEGVTWLNSACRVTRSPWR